MTKEEIANEAALRILREVYTLNADADSQIAAIISQAITDYIRSTPPESGCDREFINDAYRYLQEPGTWPNHSVKILLDYIDHLERTVMMLMDEGAIYEQGRLAAKREWEDREKELVELLKQSEWRDVDLEGRRCCHICGGSQPYIGHPPGHVHDCQLALAIGAKRREL